MGQFPLETLANQIHALWGRLETPRVCAHTLETLREDALVRGLSPSHRPRSPRSVPRSGNAAQEVRQERRLRLLRGNRLSAVEPISQINAQLLVRSWDNGWDNRRGSIRNRIALKRRQRNDLVGFELFLR